MRVTRKNDLSLRLLEVFGAVMLHRTTVDAAEDLGVSQPAVSLSIKQLEKQLGFTLFERRSQRLQPTEEARSLFGRVEPILLQLRSVETHVQDLRNGTAGNLRIMATPPLGHSVIPKVLRSYLADRPGVTVEYDVRRMEHVIEEVEVGSADLGLVLGLESHQAVDVRVLRSERMVALVPEDHPLAHADIITPSDCVSHGHIGLDQVSRLGVLLRYAFQAHGVPYQPRVVVRYCHHLGSAGQCRHGGLHRGSFHRDVDGRPRAGDPPLPAGNPRRCLFADPPEHTFVTAGVGHGGCARRCAGQGQWRNRRAPVFPLILCTFISFEVDQLIALVMG